MTIAGNGVFLNQTEINAIIAKINAGTQPFASANAALVSLAEGKYNNTPNQSVTFGGSVLPSSCGDAHNYWVESGYILDTDPLMADRLALRTMSQAVVYLGLAYAISPPGTLPTGRTKAQYAEKAKQLIKAWCIDPTTKMTPAFTDCYVNGEADYARTRQVRNDLAKFSSAIFYSINLIWDYLDTATKTSLTAWITALLADATWCYCNNYEDYKIELIASGAACINNSTYMTIAINRFKELVDGGFACGATYTNQHAQIDDVGRMYQEIYGSNCSGAARLPALTYSMAALYPLVNVAEVARHYGTDLYHYNGKLEKALDFYATYLSLANPKAKWIADGYSQTWDYNYDNASLYELAYSVFRKSAYQSVITRVTRPMYDYRILGPVTLTHGDASIVICQDPIMDMRII